MRNFYVVYTYPTDYPQWPFVVRRHCIEGQGKKRLQYPSGEVWTAPTLDAVRRYIPPGAVRMERDPRDEPQIVEWWF